MLVFRVRFAFDPGLDLEARNDLLDAWVIDVIEANELQFGGGGSGSEWSGVVETDSGEDATEAHRELVKNWLEGNEKVLSCWIGPLEEDVEDAEDDEDDEDDEF